MPAGTAIFPQRPRLDLLARRLLAMQFDTDAPADMIKRYDTPDALLVILHPGAEPGLAQVVERCTGQVAVATTLRNTRADWTACPISTPIPPRGPDSQRPFPYDANQTHSSLSICGYHPAEEKSAGEEEKSARHGGDPHPGPEERQPRDRPRPRHARQQPRFLGKSKTRSEAPRDTLFRSANMQPNCRRSLGMAPPPLTRSHLPIWRRQGSYSRAGVANPMGIMYPT